MRETWDSLVVGAGVMGSAIALRLAQAGQRVLVLERSVPGAEASSAAGGILGAQVESHEDGPLARLCLESRRRWASFAEEIADSSGASIGYKRSGVLKVVSSIDELIEEDEGRAWQRILGHKIERLARGETLELEPCLAARVVGALYFPADAQVDAQALAEALPEAARRAGVEFRRALVDRVRIDGDRAVGVLTEAGEIDAGAVIVAAGAWTALVEGTGLPEDAVRPMRGQMVELALDDAALRRVVFSSGGYSIPRQRRELRGRVICGSTMELVGYQKQVTASGIEAILSSARATVPVLGAAQIVRTWAGFRPLPIDGLPLIGPTPTESLFVASGHHRNGILLTPVTADRMADHVLGRDPASTAEPDPFEPKRLWRPPEPEPEPEPDLLAQVLDGHRLAEPVA